MQVQPVIDEARAHKNNKYKANFNYSVGVFKDRFIRALLTKDPKQANSNIAKLLYRLSKNVNPEKPSRKYDGENGPRKQKFYSNYKSNC
jgi:hypothetical protein